MARATLLEARETSATAAHGVLRLVDAVGPGRHLAPAPVRPCRVTVEVLPPDGQGFDRYRVEIELEVGASTVVSCRESFRDRAEDLHHVIRRTFEAIGRQVELLPLGERGGRATHLAVTRSAPELHRLPGWTDWSGGGR